MAKSLGAARWHELDATVQRALRWLNATALLAIADLCQVVWLEPVSQRNIALCLQRWSEAELILSVDDGRSYQLGPVGATKLQDGGIEVTAPTQLVSARVRPGLLLASRFAVGLWQDLRTEPAVGGLWWTAQPFSGSGARPDAVGLLLHTFDRSPCDRVGAELLTDAAAPTELYGMQVLTQIVLEIDSGAESVTQLRERARARHAAFATMTPLPENTMLLPLCVTSGGWERAGTIWQVWMDVVHCPLWVTTEAALRTADGDLRPWQGARGNTPAHSLAVWRDEQGRPRSLNPWELHETQWRYRSAGPPTVSSLAAAIDQWEMGAQLRRSI